MPMSELFVVSGGTGSRTVRSTASGLSHFVFLFALSACAVLLQGVLGYPESGTGIFSQEEGLRGSFGYAGTIAVQSAATMAFAPKSSRGDATDNLEVIEMVHPKDLAPFKPEFLPPCGGHELLPSSCSGVWNSSMLTMASRAFSGSRFWQRQRRLCRRLS